MPRPMPGPIAARPMTRPLPIVVSPSKFPDSAPSTCTMPMPPFLVLFRQRAADVGRGEDGEDERLQNGNEDLEADQDNRQRERERREHDQQPALQHRDGPEEEDRRRKWPARKLAQSRTESVIGRITIVVMNSIGTSRM